MTRRAALVVAAVVVVVAGVVAFVLLRGDEKPALLSVEQEVGIAARKEARRCRRGGPGRAHGRLVGGEHELVADR